MSDKIYKETVASGGEYEENAYRLAEELGMQERNIIDFSSPVNPLGVSKKIKAEMRKNLKYQNKYPDSEAKRLRKRLAQYHGVSPDMILCGNGSTGLIYLVARVLKPQNIFIPAPTYSGYERTCKTIHDLRLTVYELKRETEFEIKPAEFITALRTSSCDAAFLCNPNNPTGRLIRKNDVLRIADSARELKCHLVVDEAYMDFCPDESVISGVADNPYLIVLRTFSAYYALPGLRIGYGVFPEHLIRILNEHKEPWTVNSLAQKAAMTALKDKVYKKETSELIYGEKRFLEKNFRKAGIEFYSSDANFYLLKMENANEICRELNEKGILVRNCADFRGLDSSYVRVAVKSHRENTVFIRELKTILDKNNIGA